MDAIIGMTASEAVAEVRLIASETGIAAETQTNDDSETLVVADNDAGSGR